MEMARAIIHEKNMDYKFWEEVGKSSSFILNCLPISESTKTPHELWSGTKPNITYFRVFGCKDLVHVPDEKHVKNRA